MLWIWWPGFVVPVCMVLGGLGWKCVKRLPYRRKEALTAEQLPQQHKQGAQPPKGEADHLHVGTEGSRQRKQQPSQDARTLHQPKGRPEDAEGQGHQHGIFVVVVPLRKKAGA